MGFGVLILIMVSIFLSVVYYKINVPVSVDQEILLGVRKQKSDDSLAHIEEIRSITEHNQQIVRSLSVDTMNYGVLIRGYQQSDTAR
jgi:hypothetical protein